MGSYHSTAHFDFQTFHRTPLQLENPITAALRRRRRPAGDNDGDHEQKSWLLEPPPESAEPELRTVRSSFRFSFSSSFEAEETAVLFLVGLEENREQKQQQWRKIEFLERRISSVVDDFLVRFRYSEIRSATRGFAKGWELGRSAMSSVYKGRIGVMRRAVAIKRVDGKDGESVRDFCRELVIASSLRNRNVVPLIGFCVDSEGLFLVYKYVSGGSLDQHLHDRDNKRRLKVLSWKARYKVASGVAQALEYLHFGSDKCIIHRDIKSSNILLSSKRRPKLCDFGLATWTHRPSQAFLCKAVKGTFGYLAPEYFQHGKLSDKTDVYAFGVVLLELLTGRQAIDQDRPQGEENLVLWAKPLLQQGEDAIMKLIDPKLRHSCYNLLEMMQMTRAAAACVSSEESKRPNIRQVIAMLRGDDIFSSDWPIFMGSNRFTRSGSHSHEPFIKRDMRGYLALAMLGVSDNEGDESYRR